jgi:hypothetical protein
MNVFALKIFFGIDLISNWHILLTVNLSCLNYIGLLIFKTFYYSASDKIRKCITRFLCLASSRFIKENELDNYASQVYFEEEEEEEESVG